MEYLVNNYTTNQEFTIYGNKSLDMYLKSYRIDTIENRYKGESCVPYSIETLEIIAEEEIVLLTGENAHIEVQMQWVK